MSPRYFKHERVNNFDGEYGDAKLGTVKHPAQVRVQSEKRAKEIQDTCKENDWVCEVEIDAEQPEDTTDLDALVNKPKTFVNEGKVGRNDPCSCGSGKKYKKCCARAS